MQARIGYRITGFQKLRGLVGDPLLVGGLGPAPPKSGPGASVHGKLYGYCWMSVEYDPKIAAQIRHKYGVYSRIVRRIIIPTNSPLVFIIMC